MKAALFLAFVATVVGANWAVETFGVVPVGFGLSAPAGLYFVGLAFGLRDALHERAGRWWVIVAILCGAALSLLIEASITLPGGIVPIAVASGAAFLLSETADLAIYEPLRERQWVGAVVASNLVGAFVDSALFLWLALGSLTLMPGQMLGKAYMIAPAIVVVWGVKRALPRQSLYAGGA